MKATGWKGETLGVRVGEANRQEYFSKDWTTVRERYANRILSALS